MFSTAHCAVLAAVLLGLFSDGVYADTYTCTKRMLGNANIGKSQVTMTKGCVYYATHSGNYVKLNLQSMSSDASGTDKKLSVNITETEFDNTGLHFMGVDSTYLSNLVPLNFTMTSSNISIKNDQGSALQFSNHLPEGSIITISGNNIFKTQKATVVLMPALVLGATTVLFENNEWRSKKSIWGMAKKGDTLIFDKKTNWTWSANKLTTVNNELNANVEIWEQQNSNLTLSGGSAIVWKGNEISAEANLYARPWYQYMSTTTLTGESTISWTKNFINSTATPSAQSYPYIWYSHSVDLNQSSSIVWEENNFTTYSPFFGRIWYQRVVLNVNHSSRVAWINNDMNITVEAEGAMGDVAVWYQGSIFKGTDTITNVTNNGSVVWSRNCIGLNGGFDAFIWKQVSVTLSTTNVSKKGHITWSDNVINATVANGQVYGWFVDKTFTTNIFDDGTVAFKDNKMRIATGVTSNCFFCWAGSKYTVADATLTVENNTIDMSSNKKDSRLSFVNGQGTVETHFRNALLRIDGNNMTTNSNLRLALLWEFITERLRVDEKTRVLMCYNKASYGRMTRYKSLVHPSSLAERLVVSYCPFSPTRTFSKTHSLPTTTTTTTTATTVATTANRTDNGSALREGAVDGGAANEEDSGICIWCIIVPIVLALLLCCLLLLLFFCCCRKKRDEHKVLDDVEAVHVVNVDHEANEHFSDINRTQIVSTSNNRNIDLERFEGVEEPAPAPAAVNPLQFQ